MPSGAQHVIFSKVPEWKKAGVNSKVTCIIPNISRFCASASSQGLFNYLSLFFSTSQTWKCLELSVSEFSLTYFLNFAFFYFCLAPSSSLQRRHLDKKPLCVNVYSCNFYVRETTIIYVNIKAALVLALIFIEEKKKQICVLCVHNFPFSLVRQQTDRDEKQPREESIDHQSKSLILSNELLVPSGRRVMRKRHSLPRWNWTQLQTRRQTRFISRRQDAGRFWTAPWRLAKIQQDSLSIRFTTVCSFAFQKNTFLTRSVAVAPIFIYRHIMNIKHR